MSKSKALSPVDAAWLHMEDPTNLMMVTAVSFLHPTPDWTRFCRTLEARLLDYDRFRMRVVESKTPLGGPYWEEDPHFTLSAHLHRVALPAPGDAAALRDFIGDLASTPLDFSKPLWQVHLVENAMGGAAFIMRFHHCIGDGTAMRGVMYRLMDMTPDAPTEMAVPKEEQEHHDWNPLAALTQSVGAALDLSRKVAGAMIHEGVETLRHPGRALELGGVAAESAAILSRVLLMPSDADTPLRGPLGVQKRTAWSSPMPLERVKEIAKRSDAKINDVLLAAVAGALRRYLIGRSTPVEGVEVRAIVPVDLRPLERMQSLGNEFGLVFLSLPVGIADAAVRIQTINERMAALKHSPEPYLFLGLLNLFGRTPMQVEEQVVQLFASKATAVMTNVAGPREQLYCAGSRVENVTFWVPQSGRLGMGVSIMSYNGGVTLGVITDAGLAPDPERITALFEEELKAMARPPRRKKSTG